MLTIARSLIHIIAINLHKIHIEFYLLRISNGTEDAIKHAIQVGLLRFL